MLSNARMPCLAVDKKHSSSLNIFVMIGTESRRSSSSNGSFGDSSSSILCGSSTEHHSPTSSTPVALAMRELQRAFSSSAHINLEASAMNCIIVLPLPVLGHDDCTYVQ